MRVKIVDSQKQTVEAEIREGKKLRLPSIQSGWRFNFDKHSKIKEAFTFVLITIDNSNEIEGCLIYKMRDKTEPYMAYIEVAPYNRGIDKKYDLVAGCLIAYACRLSFIHGKDAYKGWLAFDVLEEDPVEEKKLMRMYSSKYNAKRFEKSTTMYITPEDGEALIERYLI